MNPNDDEVGSRTQKSREEGAGGGKDTAVKCFYGGASRQVLTFFSQSERVGWSGDFLPKPKGGQSLLGSRSAVREL